MSRILRASVSLDGKLLGASGKPLRRAIPIERVREASELHLTIYPLVTGEEGVSLLSGFPDGFLPKELRFDVVSVKSIRGTLLVRYRRTGEQSPLRR